jgi:hypothetical protein
MYVTVICRAFHVDGLAMLLPCVETAVRWQRIAETCTDR